MKLQFWGVRGAVPTPGREYLRYGGNTCCTVVTGAGGELVVLDVGTGFCQFGDTLLSGPFGQGRGQMVVLLTHTHWDHILGLPFPAVVHMPGNQLLIYGPERTQDILDVMLAPVYSPVYGLAHMAAAPVFHTITTAPVVVGGLTVRAWPFSHGHGAQIWAYRLEEQERSLVYITDVRYESEVIRQQAVEFARGADLLIHSAPYTCSEQVQNHGHSCIEDAIETALQAGVRRLVFFHHAPERSDDDLDALLEHWRGELRARGASLALDAAAEGPQVEV